VYRDNPRTLEILENENWSKIHDDRECALQGVLRNSYARDMRVSKRMGTTSGTFLKSK
jgi:hypothetical protein